MTGKSDQIFYLSRSTVTLELSYLSGSKKYCDKTRRNIQLYLKVTEVIVAECNLPSATVLLMCNLNTKNTTYVHFTLFQLFFVRL